MNLTKITTDYILNKHPELKSLTNDVLVMLAKKAAERKRNVSLVEGAEFLQVIARYPNVTESEIPYKIMKDIRLGCSWNSERYRCEKSLFHLLLEHRQLLLEDHKIFEDALSWMCIEDREDDYQSRRISPELIEYLYTKILTPQNLLDDIKEISKISGDKKYYKSFHICFEDEATWECIVKADLVSL